MNTPPKVALLIETSNEYARGLLRGIVGYIREHQAWSLYLSEHNRGDRAPAWLSSWDGGGIIARIENSAIAEALRRLSVPMVDVSAARLIPSLPWFETDDSAIAHLAAEHLLERGFTNFAYAGDSRFNWSNWREEHFINCVRAAGHQCTIYRGSRRFSPGEDEQVDDLAKWVSDLPKPVGVMACYDFRGQQVLDACRRINVAVPDEVAVIGVDNDELLCELASPPLSSVIPNTYRTGYEAAALLAEMMAGRSPKNTAGPRASSSQNVTPGKAQNSSAKSPSSTATSSAFGKSAATPTTPTPGWSNASPTTIRASCRDRPKRRRASTE